MVSRRSSVAGSAISAILTLFLLSCCGTGVASAQTNSLSNNEPTAASAVPAGTILPVRLQTTISLKAKPGQIIRAEIAQDVPLPGGLKIPKGSKVEGHVVEVVSSTNGVPARISIRFDKLYSHGEVTPMTTDLRAMAGFMEVLGAAIPAHGTGESEVANWLTTTQVGGDAVYGVGGEVENSNDQVVGKSLISGGVLVTPQPNGKCRGIVDENDRPQALWVFSADACGAYGLSKVTISHAGRTDPVGTFTLDVQSRKAKVASGAGLLLRVLS